MPEPPVLEAIDAEHVELWRSFLEAQDLETGAERDEAMRMRQALFAAAYVDSFDRGTALRVAGITHHTYGKWRTDPAFRALCDAADAQIRERVAGEVYRRAVIGVEQGIWHQGRLVGTERKYSDRMLELLAKRVDPAWSEHAQASSGERSTSALVARILGDDNLRAAAMALAAAASERGANVVIEAATAGELEPGGSAAGA